MTRSIRNVEVAGHRTSMRLEQQFWDAVHYCARERGLTVNQMITDAAMNHRDPAASVSSALRVYLIEHFRNLMHQSARDRSLLRPQSIS